ncbi:MAG: hypothetical protein IKG22_11915 [Atopobiaceae bacterium]|nr:hypothetical protein [Atopobiaceae bacterium]
MRSDVLTPNLQVTDAAGTLLVKGADYVLVYYDAEGQELASAPTIEGTFYVAARAIGGTYSGETDKCEFSICDTYDIGSGIWDAYFENDNEFPCSTDGLSLPNPTISRWDSDEQQTIALTPGVDFEFVGYEGDETPYYPGYYYAAYEGRGDYHGRRTIGFYLEADEQDLTFAQLLLSEDVYDWTGTPVVLNLDGLYANGDYIDSECYSLVYYDANGQKLASAPTEAGTYYATARATGDEYRGETARVEFRICAPNDIGSDNNWYAQFTSSSYLPYTGQPIELPLLRMERYLEDDDEYLTLTYGQDYRLDHIEDADGNTVSAAIEKGAYYAVYEGINDYTGIRRVRFQVVDSHDLSYAKLSLESDEVVLVNGIAAPRVTVTDASGKELVPLRDYVVRYCTYEYDDNGNEQRIDLPGAPTEPGDYYVYAVAISGSGYDGSTHSQPFEVYDPNDISSCWNAELLDDSELIYTGEQLEVPALRVYRYDENDQLIELIQGRDFELDHVENGDNETIDTTVALSTPGEYYFVYKGMNPYFGNRRVWLEVINGLAIETSIFRNTEIESIAWTGQPIGQPSIDLYQCDEDGYYTQLVPGEHFSFDHYETEDYEVIDSVVDPGDYYAVYKGEEPYTGMRYVEFEVEKEVAIDEYDLQNGEWSCAFANNKPIEWTGEDFVLPALEPLVFRFDDDGYRINLTEGEDFALSFYKDEEGNRLEAAPTKTGTYSAVYEGKAPYKGYLECDFVILDSHDLAEGYLSLANDEFVVSDAPVVLTATVYDYNDNELREGVDYKLVYMDENYVELEAVPSAKGDYYVYAKAIGGGYSGETSRVQFSIVDSSGSTDPVEPVVVGPITMELSTEHDVEVGKNGYWIGVFTAIEAGTYEFSSTGNEDTYGYLYADAALTDKIASDDDDGESSNFSITKRLSAGQTVYLKVREYGDEAMSCGVSVQKCDEHDLSLADAELDWSAVEAGDASAPRLKVTDAAGTVLAADDYELLYAQYVHGIDGYKRVGGTPSNPGEYKVYARAKASGPYTGKTIACYFVLPDPFDLADAEMTLAKSTFVATGDPITPDVTVKSSSGQLLEVGRDYELAYFTSYYGHYERLREAPTEPGSYWVTVIAKKDSSYTGECSGYFQIVDPTNILGASVEMEQNTYVYDGSAKTPVTALTMDGRTLVEGTDYEVTYLHNINAGYGYARIEGKGSYGGITGREFYIAPAAITSVSGAQVATYSGSAVEQDKSNLTVQAGNLTLGADDYTLSYANNTNAGTATLTVTGKGNYTGSVETTFAISPATITSVEVVAGAEGFTFTGEEIRPELKVMAGDLTLAAIDYDAVYANNVSMGEASVTVTGKGNFTGNATTTFQIAEASFAGAMVSAADQVYTGQALEPPVTVTLGGKTLIEGKDYSVSFQNNTNAGEAQIVATGMGDYSGSATGTFQIEQANLSGAQVVPARQTYTGEALEPAVTVTLDGRALAEGDFTATYSNNTNAGTGSVAIQGKGNYKGSASGEFTIDPRAITSVDGAATVQYTGHQISPQFTVVADGVTLSASDYGVTYEGDLVELGEVVATITAKGNFTGELTYRFSIVDEPADPNDPNSVAGKLSGELAAAQQAADDAAADVADKQQKYDAAKAAYDEAKAAAESDEQYASLQAAKEAAQLELDEAIANRDAKQQALDDAQAAVTENNEAITQAQTTLVTKQTAATQAASDYEAALTAEQAKKGVRDAAQADVNTKQAAVDAAEAAAAVEVAKGSIGFFDAKGSTTASGYLTDTTSMGYYSGGSVSFASLTNVGAATDATALANMLEAIDWIEYCNNTYRVPNGLAPLKISDNMMASAQRNANFSTYRYTHALDENGYMNMAEDGDGGSGENLYRTRIGKEAAYRGWYDAEKETWDAAVAADPSLVKYVGDGYQLMQDNPTLYFQVGHYFNIADPSYNVTGIGLNSTSNGAAIQQFAEAGSSSSMGGTYTVDEYRQRFLAYYNAIAGDDVAANEKAALADAQAALDDAQADYKAAQANTAQKKQAKDDADAEVTTAQAALDALEGQSQSLAAAVTNAQNDLQAAETVVTNKQDAYDTAEAALTSYAAETTANLNRLKGEMDAAETALNAAKATQAAADEALAAVQATFTQAHTITDDNVQITGINDFTYTGTARKQSGLSVLFRMTVGDKTETYQLVEDTDYAIGYSGDATNVGTVTMTIAGKGDYSGAVVRTYGITPATITSVDAADTTFTGSALGTTLVVKAGDLTLEPSDYDVVYDKNTNAGTATVTVTGKGNFQGSKTTEFLIAQADVSAAQVSAPNQAYTGNALEPEVTVKLGEKTLVAGDDYDVVYKGNTNAGTATITVTGKGNYVGTATGSFTIASASIKDAQVVAADQAYTGREVTSQPTVTLGEKTLVAGTDYEVAFANNTNAGTATVTVTGKGNYAGSATGTFQIARKDIAGATVTVLTATYTGEELKPEVTVTLEGKALATGTDYEVAYANNTNAGTANVTVTGKGNYTGTVTSSFTINAASIANAEVTVASQPYTGKALEPKVTVKLGSKVIPTSEYEVSWSEELVNMGTHTITVRGLGKNLTGTKNVDFVITKALSSISIEDQTKTYTGKAVVYDAKPTTSGSLGEVTYAYFHDEQCLMPVDAAYVKNAGTYYVRATLAGDSNHEGAESNVAKLTIAPATIAGAAISSVANKTYNGKAQTQNPVVKLGATTLKAGTDYTISYKNNINAGRATLTVTGKGNYTGAKTATFVIAKAANPMVATAKKVTLKASTLKKKAQKVKANKAMTIVNNQGAISYKLVGVAKKKFKKYFTVAQNGKITVKKKLKKGTYKVKINVTAAGNANYNALTKLVTVTVKVK